MSTELRLEKRKMKAVLLGEEFAVPDLLGVHGPLTSHLEFTDDSGAYSSWENFLEGAHLPCPKPERRPDVFLADEESLARLKRSVKLDLGQSKKTPTEMNLLLLTTYRSESLLRLR